MALQQLALVAFATLYSLHPTSRLFNLRWVDILTFGRWLVPFFAQSPQQLLVWYFALSTPLVAYVAELILLGYVMDTCGLQGLCAQKIRFEIKEIAAIISTLEALDPTIPPLLSEAYTHQRYIVAYDINKTHKVRPDGTHLYYVDVPRLFFVRTLAEQTLLNTSVASRIGEALRFTRLRLPHWGRADGPPSHKPPAEADLCAICFDDLVASDSVIQLDMCCRKVFHAHCFCYWLGILEMPVEVEEPAVEPLRTGGLPAGDDRAPPPSGIRDFWNRLRLSITRLNDDLPRMMEGYLNNNAPRAPARNLWEALRPTPPANRQQDLIAHQRKVETRQRTIQYLVKKCPLCAHLYLLDANQFYNHQYAFYNKTAPLWKAFRALWKGQDKNMDWGGRQSMCLLFAYDFFSQCLCHVGRTWASPLWIQAPDWVLWNLVAGCAIGWTLLAAVGLSLGRI